MKASSIEKRSICSIPPKCGRSGEKWSGGGLAPGRRRNGDAPKRNGDAPPAGPPGHVFRDCETYPEMVVLPGSAVVLGRYEVTVGEYREFASATSGGAGSRLFTPRRWQRRRPLLAEPGLSPDGPPSRDMSELERGPGVCVLVTSRGDLSGRQPRAQQIGPVGPARERGRVDVALPPGQLWAPCRVRRLPRREGTGVARCRS